MATAKTVQKRFVKQNKSHPLTTTTNSVAKLIWSALGPCRNKRKSQIWPTLGDVTATKLYLIVDFFDKSVMRHEFSEGWRTKKVSFV